MAAASRSAPGHAVNIAQPGAGSVLLNRVMGNELSTIAGSLTANGRVFLVNPNGVLFGKGASRQRRRAGGVDAEA